MRGSLKISNFEYYLFTTASAHDLVIVGFVKLFESSCRLAPTRGRLSVHRRLLTFCALVVPESTVFASLRSGLISNIYIRGLETVSTICTILGRNTLLYSQPMEEWFSLSHHNRRHAFFLILIRGRIPDLCLIVLHKTY